MESAEVNIKKYRASGVPRPSQVIFQTWYPVPAAILPETEPSAFSALVLYFFSPAALQAPPVSLLRLYNASLSRHFYTTDSQQAASLTAHGWVSEPPAGNVYRSAQAVPGLRPLYRLTRANGDCVFTVRVQEKTSLQASGFHDAGIIGYVFEAANPAGQPLYHADSTTFHHFYTCNREEYNGLTGPTWTKDGVNCAMP